MKKVVIIDDEPLARMLVAEYLETYENLSIVETCKDGFEGIKAITQHQPDLIFLDIQMPKITGFEMIELLDELPHIIFTTAFDEYAMKAFDAHAVDYLLKPFSKERFDKAIQKWIKQNGTTTDYSELIGKVHSTKEEQNRIVVKTGQAVRIIPITEIVYMEAYDDYVKLFTAQEYFLKKQTMSYFEHTLPPSEFIRIHRSFIVRISEITKIEGAEEVILKNGKKLPVSRSGHSRLKEVLGF